MKYQLVLQFQGSDEDTIEKVTEFEDQVIDMLGSSTSAEVDGQEVGEGVVNLSIMVKNAEKVWEAIEPLVEADDIEGLELAAVAYRDLDAQEYVVLWPADFEGEFAA